MRHQVRGKKLNRNTHQRTALFKSLLNSLILKEKIKTTEAKAKAVQGLFDKLVSKGKLGTVHARRLLAAFLGNQSAVNKLVDDLAPRMKARPSGFTRITKLGLRKGDNTQVVSMELVDPKPAAPAPVATPKKKEAPVKKATKTAPKSAQK